MQQRLILCKPRSNIICKWVRSRYVHLSMQKLNYYSIARVLIYCTQSSLRNLLFIYFLLILLDLLPQANVGEHEWLLIRPAVTLPLVASS